MTVLADAQQAAMSSSAVIIRLAQVGKSFGSVRALAGVDLMVSTGEVLGLVGHNGAGKSTLMRILSGTIAASQGSVTVGSAEQRDYSINAAQRLGIRCVFQELSLCPNLTVAENTCITDGSLTGFSWLRRATRLITSKLDEIFPGHGISAQDLVGDLAIGQRQMVEIARAYCVTRDPLHLIILDEPTSSLDPQTSGQLLAHMRRTAATGLSTILISHMLGEIVDNADRIVVMRDGTVVRSDDVAAFNRETLVLAMGNTHRDNRPATAARVLQDRPTVVEATGRKAGPISLAARKGEIIGLAGLAGHGQTRMLLRIFRAATSRQPGVRAEGRVALVAGDRQTDGIFPLWSITENIAVRSMRAMTRYSLISRGEEDALGAQWRQRIGIRTPDMRDNILTLSGGNQQKTLFARALASDADIVLMDDPMRGVDIGTKLDVYDIIRKEAENGRTFIWYTTEFEELDNCDRVYVFRNDMITAALERDEVSEERVISSSFEEDMA
ncbi:MAG TPA: sugar ABC transporter ATP-binding protein [Rhodopila sp.]|nr:sugar ABC transporter ATP-binding protein [Rhodopila sp.]